ncbi:hypothetical protein NDU88_008656 [Pleurodeles waltl]|uniref:Uncharacterized protein n=1 Tax=Pleurodeles waltl TaxID=8319 RepID=A0AAV7RT07_PLEWA|nr:hypothetical protein NDU88_008656 [Pleurodeles waltl]
MALEKRADEMRNAHLSSPPNRKPLIIPSSCDRRCFNDLQESDLHMRLSSSAPAAIQILRLHGSLAALLNRLTPSQPHTGSVHRSEQLSTVPSDLVHLNWTFTARR